MRQILIMVSTAFVLVFGGCVGLRQPSSRHETASASVAQKVVKSETLSVAFARNVTNLVSLMNQAGKPPEGSTEPAFLLKQMEALEQTCPGALMVSETEEARFKQGEFDDDANKKLIERILDDPDPVLLDVSLPGISIYLAQEERRGRLKGVDLELTARLLAGQLRALKAKAQKPDAEPSADR